MQFKMSGGGCCDSASARGGELLRLMLLTEQEIRSKSQKHNTTENQERILINVAVVEVIPAVSRVDGGVARQQQPGDGNVIFTGSPV